MNTLTLLLLLRLSIGRAVAKPKKNTTAIPTVSIDIEVRDHSSLIRDAKVYIYADNDLIGKKTLSGKNLRCELELDKYYTLEVKKEGYLAKRIVVNTHTSSANQIERLQTFAFSVTLFQPDKFNGRNISELDFPTALLYIDEKKKCLKYNEHYTDETEHLVRLLSKESR